MSESIYDEALEDLAVLVKQANARKLSNNVVANRWGVERITKIIEQAQKQELEHIEYSKKVKEQFANDTKHIGELQSKLIKQEKLLNLYRYLNENTNDYDLHQDTVDEIHKQIKELENENTNK